VTVDLAPDVHKVQEASEAVVQDRRPEVLVVDLAASAERAKGLAPVDLVERAVGSAVRHKVQAALVERAVASAVRHKVQAALAERLVDLAVRLKVLQVPGARLKVERASVDVALAAEWAASAVRRKVLVAQAVRVQPGKGLAAAASAVGQQAALAAEWAAASVVLGKVPAAPVREVLAVPVVPVVEQEVGLVARA
jgi:hypothetical protein